MLIQLLQEASSLSLTDLKKAMQKDKRVEPVFKKASTLADVQDKDAFLSTLKYWLFNNENVKSFVKMRNNVRDVDVETFNGYRKMRGADLNENRFGWLKEFVSQLFKEHTSVQNGTLSRDSRKALDDFVNGNGGYHNLTGWVQREIASVPGLRPTKRVLLYRGLLFSEWSLKSREKYDGTLEKGPGLKFLESIRKGSRVVDLEWDRPSSWTTSKEVAERFAKYGPASSSFGATMKWLQRGQQEIDGAVGFVISMFAEPDDILIDVGAYSSMLHQAHGDEDELIVKPGTYTCRIVKKYTVEGETDPEVKNDKADSVLAALEAVRQEAKDFVLPGMIDIAETFSTLSPLSVLSDMATFRRLVLDSTTTEVNHSYDKLIQLYKKILHDISDADLAADKWVGTENADKIEKLAAVLQKFRSIVSHSKFKVDFDSKGDGAMHNLSSEEYRQTINPRDLRIVEKDLLIRGRITDIASGRTFSQIAKYVNVSLPASAPFHMFGAAKQAPVIDEVLTGFFKQVGITAPDESLDRAKLAVNLIRKAARNYNMLNYIKQTHRILGELN